MKWISAFGEEEYKVENWTESGSCKNKNRTLLNIFYITKKPKKHFIRILTVINIQPLLWQLLNLLLIHMWYFIYRMFCEFSKVSQKRKLNRMTASIWFYLFYNSSLQPQLPDIVLPTEKILKIIVMFNMFCCCWKAKSVISMHCQDLPRNMWCTNPSTLRGQIWHTQFKVTHSPATNAAITRLSRTQIWGLFCGGIKCEPSLTHTLYLRLRSCSLLQTCLLAIFHSYSLTLYASTLLIHTS